MTEQDKEASAITAVVNALAPLDEVSCLRVLDYAMKRFAPTAAPPKLHLPSTHAQQPQHGLSDESISPRPGGDAARHADIKTLKEEKQPSNAIQMAVLVAYYLKEIVPAGERKESIGSAEVTKYFNQARFPLPTGKNGLRDTLNNARRSGYLETAGTGQFRLTPVGHNLAAYKLPRKSAGEK